MKSQEELAYSKISSQLDKLAPLPKVKIEKPKDLNFLKNLSGFPKPKLNKKIEPSKQTPTLITQKFQPVYESAETIAAKLNTLPEGLGVHVIKGIPTVEDVIKAIKELKGNDRLDVSNLRNGEQLSRVSQRIDMNDMRWHGGGSAGGTTTTAINNEVVAGSGTTFTLANVPTLGSQRIFGIGQRLTPTVDYTISGATITTISSWNAGDILADYQY